MRTSVPLGLGPLLLLALCCTVFVDVTTAATSLPRAGLSFPLPWLLLLLLLLAGW